MSDAMDPYGSGQRQSTLFELCSQKCMKNRACVGFSMTTGPLQAGWYTANWIPALKVSKCALKGDKVKLRVVGDAPPWQTGVHRYYYGKKTARNDEWHYWPCLNFSSSGVQSNILPSPTFAGHSNSLVGLGAAQGISARIDSYNEPDMRHDRLRLLMTSSYPGGFRKHDGDSWGSYQGGRATHDVGYGEGFSYEERGHTGDGKVFGPVVREKHTSEDLTAKYQVVALPESSLTTANPPAAELTSGSSFFAGGLYYARKKPTCGGNSLGLPCVFGNAKPGSVYEAEWNMCSYQSVPSLAAFDSASEMGSPRPWCYVTADTNAATARWGYCDCDTSETEWSRPVGWLPTFHNVGGRRGTTGGDDIYLNTDDFHHPIIGLMYEARQQATRVNVNGSLCVRSEHYGPFVDGAHFKKDDHTATSAEPEISCPAGEVLTGFASTGEYAAAQPPPPAPFQQFTYHASRKTFSAAEAYCVQQGGHLASLHSQEDVDAVMALAGGDSWIGLQRTSTSSAWSWSDGTSYGTDALNSNGDTELWNTDWGTQGNDNICGRWGWGSSKTWDDVTCYETQPFTCGFVTDEEEPENPNALIYGPTLTKSAPRCGVPAGYVVHSAQRSWASRVTDDSPTVAKSDGCHHRAMTCPAGSVAVGFKYDKVTGGHGNEFCGKSVLSLVLSCAPYTVEDSPDFKRMCANADCADHVGAATNVGSVDECTALCGLTPGCLSVRITDIPTSQALLAGAQQFAVARTCELFTGVCKANALAPYGNPKEKPLESYSFTKPAVFTPVELEHPTTAEELASFEASKVSS